MKYRTFSGDAETNYIKAIFSCKLAMEHIGSSFQESIERNCRRAALAAG